MKNPTYFCRHCKTFLFRNAKHDVYFCPRCDRWDEETCGDPACRHCETRPPRPSEARLRVA